MSATVQKSKDVGSGARIEGRRERYKRNSRQKMRNVENSVENPVNNLVVIIFLGDLFLSDEIVIFVACKRNNYPRN